MRFESKTYTVQELIDAGMLEEPLDGNHGSIHPKASDYVSSGVPFIMANDLVNGKVDYSNCVFITEEQASTLRKGFAKPGDVLLTHKATIGRTAIVTDEYETIILTPQVTYYRVKNGISNTYLKCYFDSVEFQQILSNWAGSGSTRAYLGITAQKKLPIVLPSYEIQLKIASVADVINQKIYNNEDINNNLLQQAQAIFDSMFPNISHGERRIGDYIVPKRGKGLLSKDAIVGEVPVVAGGLEPSTYHNIANTKAPVLAISASGANAGYVSLWHSPIWSSDSSFIDSSMTDNVFFWYVLLKKRQKEIFDAQTGSAQPHIYPQHIAAMPIIELNKDLVKDFTNLIKPLFKIIGDNNLQNQRLSILRDTLLPKLLSGELDVSEVEI